MDDVTACIRRNCKLDGAAKVFTFGIGDGCSRELVIKSAKVGKGTYNFAEDVSLDKLRA